MTAFRVLFVCTANHCRSPIAQQLLSYCAAQKFGSSDTWSVESAGTDIPGPWPLHEYAAAAIGERMPQVADHVSTNLDAAAIGRADLVLTATRRHRSVVVSSVPAAIGRSFTILQFARLCEAVSPIPGADPGELGRQLIVDAKLARSTLQPVPGELDDLPDPMGQPMTEFRLCADRIQAAVDTILRPLRFG
ncbi:MAG: low molecular weight phosphatase family protein [Nakamurella sp.]